MVIVLVIPINTAIFLQSNLSLCTCYPIPPIFSHSTFIDQTAPPKVYIKSSSHAGQRAETQNYSLVTYVHPSSLPSSRISMPYGLQTLSVTCTFHWLLSCTWAKSKRLKVKIQERKLGLRAKVFKRKDNKFWWTITRWKQFQILISIMLLASYSSPA